MTDELSSAEAERQLLIDAEQRGMFAKLRVFTKLSGPGWLQSAITLGGGSLASSLYLGVLGGFALLWVQPLAMILGIVMLSAIGYVTLSTGARPFRAINEHVNPVLGWGWALAVGSANVVWCLPQYSLANGVLSQNLLPSVLGDGTGDQAGWLTRIGIKLFSRDGAPPLADSWAEFWSVHLDELVVVTVIFLLATAVTWSYDRGGWGLRLYELILKTVVALIVACFVGVVVVMSVKHGLDWEAISRGFIPDFSLLVRPADTFYAVLDKIGPESDAARKFWVATLVDQQQDVLTSAAATAVGINMTFLFAYSLLRKGWTKEYRGLLKFDLCTGMLIPFFLATSCVVIAAASQFHTQLDARFEVVDGELTVPDKFSKEYESLLERRERAAADAAAAAEDGAETPVEPTSDSTSQASTQMSATPSLAEKELAAMLVKRDAFELAKSLKPMTGDFVANYVFGFGVLAMTLSTISLLMLISGFVFTEVLGLPPGGWPHRIGTLIAGVCGALGPFVWKQAAFYLAVPTSVFGFVLLPLAYLTFFFLMNSRYLLGEHAPQGIRRLIWNTLMFISAAVATVGSVLMIHKKGGSIGIAAVAVYTLLALVVHINRKNNEKYDTLAQGDASQ